MSEQDKEITSNELGSETPADGDLFVGQVSEELSPEEVFAGDEEFFAQFSLTANPEISAQEDAEAAFRAIEPSGGGERRRFSLSQKVLAASIVAVAGIMTYAYLNLPPAPTSAGPPVRQEVAVKPEKPAPAVNTDRKQPEPAPIKASKPSTPVSLSVAEALFAENDHSGALAMYRQLYESLGGDANSETMKDYMQLKMALCMEMQGDAEEAGRQLRAVSGSRSPAVKMLAAFHRALLEMRQQRYLNARSQAYKAIAIAAAVDADQQGSTALLREAYFLVAKAVTLHTLSLSNSDRDLPSELWPKSELHSEYLAKANESRLRAYLAGGIDKLNKALLGPELGESGQGADKRYTIVCNGAPAEELIARFTSNAGLDVQWAPDAETVGIRRRAVHLYMPEASEEDFLRVAAGSNGLLARVDANNVLSVTNPGQYASLSEHAAMMAEEAASLWQTFLLRFPDDKRHANAHYAAALVLTHTNVAAEAIAEFKMVANRHSKSPLAPHALLNSGRIKTGLRDFVGAHQDLKQLVDQYPDSEFSDQACLHMAEAAMKARMYNEASRLFAKVHNLAFSKESRRSSALGAGRCFYETEDYETAAKWLTRYVNLAMNAGDREFSTACLLLGKANLALGKEKEACSILRHALSGRLSRDDYAETVMSLAEGYAQREEYVEALDILQRANSEILSVEHGVRLVVIEAGILRGMGLIDSAMTTLKRKNQYLSDPTLKGTISLELARCSAAMGNKEDAQQRLTATLTTLEPGELAHEVQYELARTCFELGQDAETLGICLQMLESGPSQAAKQKTLELLAGAYRRQKNYDKAAQALLGQWKVDSPNGGKTVSMGDEQKPGYNTQ